MAINERRGRSEDDLTVVLAAGETKNIPRGGRNYIVISTTTDGAVKIGVNTEPARPLRQGCGDGVSALEADFTELNFYNSAATSQTVVLQTSYGTLIDNRFNAVGGNVPVSLSTANLSSLIASEISTALTDVADISIASGATVTLALSGLTRTQIEVANIGDTTGQGLIRIGTAPTATRGLPVGAGFDKTLKYNGILKAHNPGATTVTVAVVTLEKT